jgi:F0F1-type ATP synthase assembly protein I
MFESLDLIGLIAVTLSLSIPIVAIVMVFITSIKKKNRDTQLRLALIEKGTDPETTKLLIEEQEEKHNKYSSLRWACVLMGMGLGALVDALLGLPPKHDIYFWLVIAAGMGFGLLISFIIEYKLTKKEQQEQSGASDTDLQP